MNRAVQASQRGERGGELAESFLSATDEKGWDAERSAGDGGRTERAFKQHSLGQKLLT